MIVLNELVEDVIKIIRGTKYKILSLVSVQKILKEKLGESYTSDISISVKEALKESSFLDFFKEDTYIENSKFQYCTGDWIAIKGQYENPVQAKNKMGWYSWQVSDDDDGEYLD